MSYEQMGAEIGRLVSDKQRAYGDSFGKSGTVMRILYPEGISLDQLDDALSVVRVIDKLFRIATDRDAFGESPWRDVVGYGLRAAARVERRRRPVTDEAPADDALTLRRVHVAAIEAERATR